MTGFDKNKDDHLNDQPPATSSEGGGHGFVTMKTNKAQEFAESLAPVLLEVMFSLPSFYDRTRPERVARELNRRGILNRNGKAWTSRSAERLVKSLPQVRKAVIDALEKTLKAYHEKCSPPDNKDS